jgi:hypothetical protein
LPGKNTLTCYGNPLITAVESIMIKAPDIEAPEANITKSGVIERFFTRVGFWPFTQNIRLGWRSISETNTVVYQERS